MKLIKCKICGKEHQGRVCSSFARSTARQKQQRIIGPIGVSGLEPEDSASGVVRTVDTENGHIWHEKIFSSMAIKCCMNCGFIKNENQPNAPCPGPIGVEVRSITPPKPKFNKTAYQRLYMSDLRAAKKIGITIREYRERTKPHD